MGSKWKIDSAQENIQKNLQDMPYYPFYRNEQYNYLFFRHVIGKAIFALVVLILLGLAIIIVGVFARAWTYFTGLCFLFVVILWLSWGYWPRRTYAIRNFKAIQTYGANGEYSTYGVAPKFEFYRGNSCTELEMHEVFIKLERRRDRSKVRHYYLILDGSHGIEKVKITREDTSLQAIREIGKDIANKVRINYFDSEDVSPHNVIKWPVPSERSQPATKQQN